MSRTVSQLVLLSFAAFLYGAAFAQGYPAKPIRMVIPFPPGGIDIPGRLIATKASEFLGQPLVIDYRAGANGVIGCEIVARAAPDGYTLLFTTSNTQIVALFTTKNLPYDPVKDFTPITITNEANVSLAVHPGNPANSVQELMESARRNPGKLSFASTGHGSFFQLIGESLKQLAGVDLLHVPYKGTGPMMQAVMADEVTMFFGGGSVIPMVAGGKLKLLAVLDSKRSPFMPNVPAITESLPGYQRLAGWSAFYGPAGLPAAVTGRVHADIARSLAGADLRQKLAENGQNIIGTTPAETVAQIRRDTEIIGRIARGAGILPE